MPYTSIVDLPLPIRKLPEEAQKIYLKAFNAGFEKFDGDESKAAQYAWGAVKQSYRKVNGKWVKK